MAGEEYEITWVHPEEVVAADVYLLPDTLGAGEIYIGTDVGALKWKPDPDLFSRSARIVVVDGLDATESFADTSDFFFIKPYHLTRLNADSSEYVPFTPGEHGWLFSNSKNPMFPTSWWAMDQFDYVNGTDPLTDDEYDDDFPDPSINASSEVFPDWPAFARAFGTDVAYWQIIPGLEAFYKDTFTAAWGSRHNGTEWGGSCYGMAVSALLSFTHREDFGLRYPSIGGVEKIHTLSMTNPIREAINELYVHQYGFHARNEQLDHLKDPPTQTLEELKARLLTDDLDLPGTISIKNVNTCNPFTYQPNGGGHAVTPYHLERDPNNDDIWRLYIYDPNEPGDDTVYITVDETANTWSYDGWGGSCGFFMRDRVVNYLNPAYDFGFSFFALFSEDSEAVYVAPTSNVDVMLTALDGSGEIGYVDDVMTNTIASAEADVPDVGGFAPPTGYQLPAGAYQLELSNPDTTGLSAFFFADRMIYSYGRQDAAAEQTDVLTFNNGLTLRSNDAGAMKTVVLRAIDAADSTMERTVEIDGMTLQGADSVHLAMEDGVIALRNYGAAKQYALQLREASAEGQAQFFHANVPLSAGATHRVRQGWETLASGRVEVEVDNDNDGQPEEVMMLDNNFVGTAIANNESVPASIQLHPAFPNPFVESTTLRYALPAQRDVRLAVYDVLGREVAVVDEGTKSAGVHEVQFNAGGLSSGLYLARLEVDGRVLKTMLVLNR